MRAAAEFAAHPVHRHHPHHVGILLAEQHHRPGVPRLGQRQELRRDGHRREHVAVDHPLDRPQRLVIDGARMREIKPQQVGVDLRSLLHGVRAEVVLERGVQEVRGRVGPPHRTPPVGVDRRGHRRAQVERSLAEVADVEHEAPLPLRVGNLEVAAGPCERAGVAHLPARLAVEGGAIEHHGHG